MNSLKGTFLMVRLLPFFLLIVLFGFCLSCGEKKTVSQEKPNIVVILLDDLGYGDISIYGNKRIETPNIDKVAKEGTRFTQFYSNSPVCSPSRVGFITGSYPFRFGVHGVIASREKNRERGQVDFLPTSVPLLPRFLKKAGYRTGHFGKWHMGGGRDIHDVPYPTQYGFDASLVGFEGIGNRILDKDHFLSDMSAKLGKGKILRTDKHRITEIYVDSALSFIRKQKEEPFYVSLFPGDVHDPFKPEEDSIQKYMKLARDREEAKFFAVLKETDRQIGRFLDSLKRMGELRNTLVIISSDNGPTDWPRYYKDGGQPPSSQGNLRGRKWSLYEGGIRVPLIARWPGKVPAGHTDTTTVGFLMDLFPTFVSLIDAKDSQVKKVDGVDLSPAFLGEPVSTDRPLFWYFPNVPKPGNKDYLSPRYAVRKGNWKLLAELDGSRTELYHLQEDPREANNVASQYPEVVADLIHLLREWDETHVKTPDP